MLSSPCTSEGLQRVFPPAHKEEAYSYCTLFMFKEKGKIIRMEGTNKTLWGAEYGLPLLLALFSDLRLHFGLLFRKFS